MKTKTRRKSLFQNILYISIIVIILQVVLSRNCEETLKDNLKHLSLYNKTNPLPNSGFGFNAMGNYDRCLKTPASKYLTFKMRVDQEKPLKAKSLFHMGLCLPEECVTRENADQAVDFIINKTSIDRSYVEIILAQEENDSIFEMDTFTIITITIISVWGILGSGLVKIMIDSFKKGENKNKYQTLRESKINSRDSSPVNDDFMVSTQDVSAIKRLSSNLLSSELIQNSQNNGEILSSTGEKKNHFKNNNSFDTKAHSLLECFDVVKNYHKLFQIDETELGVRVIKGINMISFFSFVFLQFVANLFHVPIRDPFTIINEFQCAYAQLIYNSDFSTDMFIATTGFLVAYYGVKDLKSWKQSHFGKVILESVKLFIKTWPFVILLFLFYFKIYGYFLDGPLSGHTFNYEISSCKQQWPYILSFMADFTYGKWEKEHPFCYSWIWIVFIEFKCTIIAFILLFIYARRKSIFTILFFIMTVLLLIIEAWFLIDLNLMVNINDINYDIVYFKAYYYKFYMRCFPYWIGFIFGMLYANYLSDIKENNYDDLRSFFDEIKMNKILSILLFILGISIMMFFIVATSWSYGVNSWYSTARFFYNFLAKKFFVLAAFVACLPLMLGNLYSFGGWFSLYLFNLLYKVRLSAIIISGLVIRYYLFNIRENFFYNAIFNNAIGGSFIYISYVLSIFVTVIFLNPFIQIEELLDSKFNTNKKNKLHLI
jgi:hypothetical protein